MITITTSSSSKVNPSLSPLVVDMPLSLQIFCSDFVRKTCSDAGDIEHGLCQLREYCGFSDLATRCSAICEAPVAAPRRPIAVRTQVAVSAAFRLSPVRDEIGKKRSKKN